MTTKIIKRDGKVVDFDRRKITFAVYRAAIACGGRDRVTAELVTDDVVTLLEKGYSAYTFPTVEEVQDLVEKCLIERGHAKTAKAYILYRYEHALKREGKRSLTYSAENIPYKKLWQALSWATDHECVTTAQMQEIVDSGDHREFVRSAEDFYREEIKNATMEILDRIGSIRLLIIAGPSASGKTTTMIKLADILRENGHRLVPINIDNYFFNLTEHPRDAKGDYDFETPQALDLELINRDLAALVRGEQVNIPKYDFKIGRRDGISAAVRLGERDILLIDSLHGMFDGMTSGIPEENKYKLYVETLAQIKTTNREYVRWSDIRMLRRMVRDMQFRNYDAKQTIGHWRYVRRSELRYIVPKLREAESIINTYLPYELLVFKHRLGPIIDTFARQFETEPDCEDARDRTSRVQALLREIPDWTDESVVPADSLLREFIGGSVYSY